jgi:hypothetical protein
MTMGAAARTSENPVPEFLYNCDIHRCPDRAYVELSIPLL